MDYFVRGDAVIASFNSAYAASKVLKTSNRYNHKIILVVDKPYKKHYKNCLIVYSQLTQKVKEIIETSDGIIMKENDEFIIILFKKFHVTATIQNILQEQKIRVEFARKRLIRQIVYEEGY